MQPDTPRSNSESFSLGDLIRTQAAERPDHLAIKQDDYERSYHELHDESSKVAQAFTAAGVQPHDRVAFLDKNTPQYFTMLFGAAKINAATVAVNWRLAPPEMSYILNHAGVKVLFIGEEFLDHLPSIELDVMPTIVVLGQSDKHTTYDDWIADHDAIDPNTPSEPNDTCFQLYTSGTTGLPKGVEITNDNFATAMAGGKVSWTIDADSVNLVAMPLFHIAGSGWGIVGLYCGATNILMRDIDPVGMLSVIPEHRITHALLVPAVIQFMLSVPTVTETDFSSLARVMYGASPISTDVLSRAMDIFGCEFCQVYGLTETTGAITQLDPEDHDPSGPRAHLLQSVGRPVPGCEIRVVDADGNDLADGEVGEVWSKTLQNLKTYYKNPEATAEAFPEGRAENGLGWFRTGDAGYLNDGFLFLTDRIKDMIVSGGENVYPAEVENVLMSHASVADVAVIGVPHDKWGETVKAVIVKADPAADISDAELIAHCRENLAGYKCPTSIDVATELPRNPSGKLLKREIRDPYWAGHDRNVN